MSSTALIKPAKLRAVSGAASLRNYSELSRRIREVFERGRRRAEKAVEKELTRTRWEAGKLIIKHVLLNKERAGYGTKTIRWVAKDFGKSYSEVKYMVELARANPKGQPAGLLSLTHHTALLSLNDKNLRDKLTQKAIREKWTRETLRAEIKKVQSPKQLAHLAEARRTLASAKPEFRSGEAGKAGNALLIPKRGKVGVFQIVKDGEGLALDFGFTLYLALEKTSKFKEGDIVELIRHPEGRRPEGSKIQRSFASLRMTGKMQSKFSTKDLFTYEAELEKIIDADTYWLKVWINHPQFLSEKLRLRGVDAPELSTPEGQRAKRVVESLFKKAVAITLTTTKPDKWDRYLSDIFLKMPDGTEIFLNNYLLEYGLARRYDAVHPEDWEKE